MIASLSNEKIKDAIAVRLNHGRFRQDAFYLEGMRLFQTALDAGVSVKRVFYTGEFAIKAVNAPLIERLRNMGIVLEEVSPQVMEKLSETQSPQGIVGIGARKQFLLGDAQTKTGKRLVICDGIKDPGNLGAIIRTADVFASDTIVILPNTTNPYAPKAIRASAGGIFNLSVVFTEKETLLPWLTNTGIRLIVTVPQGGKRIRDIDMLKPFAVVIGEEAAGVATDIIGMADELATIPMGGITGSLNAAAAAAVFLYESFRVRAESGVDTVD